MMMMNRAEGRRSFVLLLLIALFAPGCTGSGFPSVTSPTPLPNVSTPTPAPPTPTPPTPAPPTPAPPVPGPGTSALNGRVTETAPTPATGIAGAIVKIASGPNAGRSTTTNPFGFYTLPDVSPGTTISVSADGYVETSRATGPFGREATNFQLMPVLRMLVTTLTDILDDKVGTCSDSLTQRPCHIVTIAIHNGGRIDADLTWQAGDGANLDLTLFRTGAPAPIGRSASTGGQAERISADIPPGATYELRITYASGTSAAQYTLRATHPN